MKTVLLTSDEPWIPWELIKPFDDSDPHQLIDDQFLCLQFQLTRWLAGEVLPAPTIQLRCLAHIEVAEPAPGLALSAGATERAALEELARRVTGVKRITLQEPQRSEVLELIRGGAMDLLHFSGHADARDEQPDEARLILAGGQGLRARSLDGPLILALKQHRPLVFLNACRAAKQGWGLTDLGGWAEAWVRRCRCSGFLGPQWIVRDRLAGEFAKTFYQVLGQGETIARAAQRARNQLRALQPGDPTWPAYTVYAHPNARVVLGEQPLVGEARQE